MMHEMTVEELKELVLKADEFKAKFHALVREYVPRSPGRIQDHTERARAANMVIAIGARVSVHNSKIWDD